MSNEMRVAGKIHNFLITSTTPCLTHTHTIEIATMMSIFSVFKIHYAYMEKLVREGMKKKNFLQFIQFFFVLRAVVAWWFRFHIMSREEKSHSIITASISSSSSLSHLIVNPPLGHTNASSSFSIFFTSHTHNSPPWLFIKHKVNIYKENKFNFLFHLRFWSQMCDFIHKCRRFS